MQGENGFNVDSGHSVVIAEWVFVGLSCVVVIARFMSKGIKDRKPSCDDYLMAIAAILAILHGVTITRAHQYGWGHDQTYLSEHDITESTKYIFFSQGLGVLSSMFGRVSFCIFMTSMIGPTCQAVKIILWFFIALQVFINVVVTIILYAQCSDIAALWDFSITTAICMAHSMLVTLSWFQSTFNALADLSLPVISVIVVFKSRQMPPHIQAGIAVLFGLSLFAFTSTILRTYQLHVLFTKGDMPWYSVKFILWTTLEMNTIIIAASIHTLFRQSKTVSNAMQAPLPIFSTEISSVRRPSSIRHRIAEKGRSLSVGFAIPWRKNSRCDDYEDGMLSSGWNGNMSQEDMVGGNGHAVLIMRTKEISIDTSEQEEARLQCPIVPLHMRRRSDVSEMVLCVEMCRSL